MWGGGLLALEAHEPGSISDSKRQLRRALKRLLLLVSPRTQRVGVKKKAFKNLRLGGMPSILGVNLGSDYYLLQIGNASWSLTIGMDVPSLHQGVEIHPSSLRWHFQNHLFEMLSKPTHSFTLRQRHHCEHNLFQLNSNTLRCFSPHFPCEIAESNFRRFQ